MSNKLAQEIVAKQSRETAERLIGNRTLYGLRLLDGRSNSKVRLFVVSYSQQYEETELDEVTSVVARVCGVKLTRDSFWIAAPNYGYDPVMGLAEAYAQAMGKDKHPYRSL